MRLSGNLTLTVTVSIRIVFQATSNVLSFRIMLLNAHSIKVLLVPFKNIFTVGIIYKEPYAIVES